MIDKLQQKLVHTYDLEPQQAASSFLCDRALATSVLNRTPDRPEMLLVVPEEGEAATSVGLYIDSEVLVQAQSHANAFLTTLEGVSHLTYVLFRTERGGYVSELELELQAEVDKYALTLGAEAMVGRGAGLIRSRRLRKTLFEQVLFRDAAHSEQGERYRYANALALRFSESLESRFVKEANPAGLSSELRRFYRMGQSQKIAHINSIT